MHKNALEEMESCFFTTQPGVCMLHSLTNKLVLVLNRTYIVVHNVHQSLWSKILQYII